MALLMSTDQRKLGLFRLSILAFAQLRMSIWTTSIGISKARHGIEICMMTDELLFAIPVVLPDKQLQDKIVAVMSSIQRLYEAEAAKSDCLQSEKAQFLRSLFA